jgi:hypothetical protein
MTYKHFIVSLTLLFTCLATPTFASMAPDNRSDRAVYNRLLNDLRQVDREYSQTLGQAMRAARTNSGQAGLETEGKLISLRDRRDRLINRISMIALRHGWDLPSSELPDAAAAIEEPPTPTDETFRGGRQIVHRQFHSESQYLAKSVQLPVISLPALDIPQTKGD